MSKSRKVKVWILFFSVLLLGSCQSEKVIEQYYAEINQAEHSFYKKEYQESFHHYKKAFEIHKPFGQDCINGIVVSRKVSQFDFCKKWMTYGTQKLGFTDEFYKTTYLLKGIDTTNIWKDFITRFNANHSTFLKNQNKVLLSSIEKLVEKDQDIRSDLYQRDIGPKEISIIREVDSLGMEQFVQLVKKHNFPSEMNCGVNINSGYLDYPKYDILLLHFCQQGWWDRLEPILRKALYTGTLSNEQYAKYADFAYENSDNKELNFYGYMLIGKCDSHDLYYPLNMDKEATINKNRRSIFLDDLTVAQKKWVSNHLCKEEFLMSKQNVSLLSIPDFLCNPNNFENSFSAEESCIINY